MPNKKKPKKKPPAAEEEESRFTGEYRKVGYAPPTEEELALLYEDEQ